MKSKTARFPWQVLPFGISVPFVAFLVSAPAFGWRLPYWPVVSLEALGALALLAALATEPTEAP